MAGAVTVKVAVLGAGLMGQWHCHFAKKCGAVVEAIVDPDSKKAAELAARFGCEKFYTDADAMFAACEANVVHICTPTATHVDLARMTIEAGRNVLIEKPIAQSLESTEALLELARSKSLLLNPIHQFPFQNGFGELIGRKNSLGDIVRLDFSTYSAGGEGKSAQQKRDVMIEILPHPISLFFQFFGHGFARKYLRVIRFTENDLELTGDFDGTAVSLVISLRGRPTRNQFVVSGTSASALVDLFHGYVLFEDGAVSRTAKMLKPLKLGSNLVFKATTNLARRMVTQEPAYPGLKKLFHDFYQAVENNTPAPISDREMLACAEILDWVRNEVGNEMARS